MTTYEWFKKQGHNAVRKIFDVDAKPPIPTASKGRKRFNELVDAAQKRMLKLRAKHHEQD